jgi:hypothetical protein
MKSTDVRRDVERRFASREELASITARVTWRGSWGSADLRVTANLLNISAGGVALRTIFPPPENCSFWMSLEQLPNEWVRCALVEVERISPRSFLWRLAFAEECPPGIIEAANDESSYGFSLTEEVAVDWVIP